jgi:hypothetical protein
MSHGWDVLTTIWSVIPSIFVFATVTRPSFGLASNADEIGSIDRTFSSEQGFNPMPFELLATAIRYGMLIVCGWLIKQGIINESIAEPLIGFVVAVSAMVWFWLGKWRPSRFNRDNC